MAARRTQAAKTTAEKTETAQAETTPASGPDDGGTAEGGSDDGAEATPPTPSTEEPAVADDGPDPDPSDDTERPCREHFPTGWPTVDGVTSVGCEHGTWSRDLD
ncbi:hypothetical protein [Streptomyces sp. NPDC050738]|uniref:hypothetical protein n=1 Tax=Streptomyces sp. NPDC050738 TaxID=3154744 RepID=UPI0034422541